MNFKQFEDIEAWQLGRELTREIYRISKVGAFSRDFVLRNQMRAATLSVPSNIAEGFERGGNKEFIQSLSISKGSAGEVRSQLYTALDEGYITTDQFAQFSSLAARIGRVIGGLTRHLKASPLTGPKFKRRSEIAPPETQNLKPETRRH